MAMNQYRDLVLQSTTSSSVSSSSVSSQWVCEVTEDDETIECIAFGLICPLTGSHSSCEWGS